jgi:hypothetical protein
MMFETDVFIEIVYGYVHEDEHEHEQTTCVQSSDHRLPHSRMERDNEYPKS